MNNIKFGVEKKKGSFFLQIKHDFYKGTIEGWKRYAIALCIFIFLCFVFQIRAEKIIQFNKISKEISFSDFILFMFRGMNVFDGNAVELQDKLPQWFLVNIYLSNLDISKFNFKGILIVGIILPVITSITFSLIQLLISLFTNSIISNMFIITVLTLTPFYCNSFFIGNYLMILRSNLNIGDSGISIVYGIVVCVVLSIATIFIGANKIKRYDILEK